MEILNSSSKKRTILYVHERTEASAGFEQMLKKSYNVISVDMTNREFADIRSSAPVLSAAIVCARSAAGENYALFEWVRHDSMVEAVPMLIYCEGKEDMEIAKEMLRTGKGTNYIIEEKADGVTDYLELIKRPVRDKDGKITGIIALINNVTEQQLLRMSLEEKALKGLHFKA